MSILSVADLMPEVIGPVRPAPAPEVSVAPASFTDLAFERLRYLLVDRYGNELTADHELVLREGIVALAHAMVTGKVSGRVAVGLPCGFGKTTAIRAILWAIHKLGLDVTAMVCCYRVEQLCGLIRQLSRPDTDEADGDGLPRHLLGLLHSFAFDERRRTDLLEHGDPLPDGYASEPAEGNARQFLFVAHERVKAGDGPMPEWMVRDLTFYDESLVVSEARVFTLLNETRDGLFIEIDGIRNLAESLNDEKYGDAARWLSSVKDRIRATLEDANGTVEVLTLPTLTPAVVSKLRTLLPAIRWPNIARLLEYANEDLRVRRNSRGHALITYRIAVPPALTNVIVTDASDPIRELVQYDARIRRVEHVMPALEKFRETGLGAIKRYDNVEVLHCRQSGGRSAMADAFQAEVNWVLKEVVRIIEDRPDEDFLLFTYLDRDGIRYRRLIDKALQKAGIERVREDGRERVSVLTWGMETALNDYGHVQNVIMAGVLLKPLEALAGEYMGQVDNLRDSKASHEPTLKSLQYSEASHLIYQAANRGAMRFTEVDAEGRSQARPCRVHVIHYDADLRQRLGAVMPGARWLPWVPHDEAEGVYEVALRVADYLRALDPSVPKVSIRKLKADLGITLTGDNWVRARDMALDGVPWHVDGQSFARMFQPY